MVVMLLSAMVMMATATTTSIGDGEVIATLISSFQILPLKIKELVDPRVGSTTTKEL